MSSSGKWEASPQMERSAGKPAFLPSPGSGHQRPLWNLRVPQPICLPLELMQVSVPTPTPSHPLPLRSKAAPSTPIAPTITAQGPQPAACNLGSAPEGGRGAFNKTDSPSCPRNPGFVSLWLGRQGFKSPPVNLSREARDENPSQTSDHPHERGTCLTPVNFSGICRRSVFPGGSAPPHPFHSSRGL